MTMAEAEDQPLLRRIRALAEERLLLHRASSKDFGLTREDHERLEIVERELDESYRQLRADRAERDRNRFVL